MQHGEPERREVLVVDLDGTLIQTDLLYETFWSAFSRSWTTPFVAAVALLEGRAALKQRLTQLSRLDVSFLPYNEVVVAYVRRWHSEGGRTALVTASNQALADEVAAHLDVFDEVHGSDANTNLKGLRKASLLSNRFGDRGYIYVGDAAADIPVWQQAARAIMVNPSSRLKAKVGAMGLEVAHLIAQARSPKAYLKTMRPHQWLKNLLIFLPMLAAHKLDPETFGRSLLAFVAFSLVASSVYVLNDLLDLAVDRAHPRKRTRPLASGALPIAHGTWLVPILLIGGLAFAVPLGSSFIFVLLCYCAATTAYSLWLKRHMIIDISTLAGLYTMRVLAGGAATGIPPSVWLLAFSIFFFFSLAAVKRQAELVDGVASGTVTAHGRSYHVNDLPVVASMATASGYVSVLIMALYLNSPAVSALYSYPEALWGICLVLLYWISRMVMATNRGNMHDDPLVFAVKDRVSLVCLMLVIAFALGGALL